MGDSEWRSVWLGDETGKWGEGQDHDGPSRPRWGFWFYFLCHWKPLRDLSRKVAWHGIKYPPQDIFAYARFGHSHHDFSLLYEVLFRHSPFLNGFDGHLVLVEPVAKMYQPKLPTANLLHKSELGGMDHPFPWKRGRGFFQEWQAVDMRYRATRRLSVALGSMLPYC